MNLNAKLSLVGCICVALLSYPASTAYGQTEGCCLPDDTCVDATVTDCTTTFGGTPMGAGSACLGDNNADGFDDLCVSPIVISEYYESAPLTRKCIELFNTGTVDFDLGANGYSIAAYTDACVNTGDRVADARGVYSFGTIQADVVPAGGVYVICAEDNGDGIPIDLLLPFESALCVPSPCNYTGGGCGGTVGSPIAANNGNDATVLFGRDISAPLDNVVDVFGVPFEALSGFPRAQFPSSRPYADVAWERRFTVTRGISDFLGFDSCNFDGLKDCNLVECPPFTPGNVNLACQNAMDLSTSNQWLFEGLNPSTSNTNHTLGSHVPDSPPIASSIRAITKLDTNVEFTPAVLDIDGDDIDVIIEAPLPSVGTIWDGPEGTGININVAGVPYTMTDSFVTFVPDAGVGTDTSLNYHGEQIAPVQIGNTATASILVEDERVIMTEVLYNPNGDQPESQWEWIEIFNTTAGPITLGELNSAGCSAAICGDNLWDGITPLTIGAGEILVIVGNPSSFGGGIARTDQQFLDLWALSASQVVFVSSIAGNNFPFLSQGGADLFLSDETGDLIDFLPSYGDAPFPADDPGHSIILALTARDLGNNNDGANWGSAVVDCATGVRAVSDTSIASPGAVPGAAASVFPPCATNLLEFTVAGSPTSKTVTLLGTLPGGGAASFKITSLPILLNGFDDQLGTLLELSTGGSFTITQASLPYTLTDPLDQITFEESGGKRHFYRFEFLAFDPGSGAESGTASVTIAVQGNSVVITEIMANPANSADPGGETYWEYLEVRNTGASPVTLFSMQATNGPTAHDFNLDTGTVPNITIPANTTRLIARDALNGSTDPNIAVRTRAAFEAEWSTASVGSTDVVYVPNAAGGNEWDGLSNAPTSPGRFVTIWDDPFDFEATGLLDVVVYQIGQNGWPANSEPNSIFYRGDANGAPFTTTGNDLAASWQESATGCAGDGAIDSFADIIGGDTTVDHGSPLALPTDPDSCIPIPCGTCLGDLSGPGGTPDGKVDALDIQAFIDLVTAPAPPLQGCADMNGDGNPLDYLPDVAPFVDALVFGSTDCPVTVTHSTNITISLTGVPVAGDIELFIGGCDPALACNVLATPPFICFERITVGAATTAADLALALAFGLDGIKDGVGGLDQFCLGQGADVNVIGPTISIVFTRAAGLPAPCCYLQDTDGRFGVAPFDFVQLGGPANCVVANLLNGVANDEGAAQGANGFSFTKSGD